VRAHTSIVHVFARTIYHYCYVCPLGESYILRNVRA